MCDALYSILDKLVRGASSAWLLALAENIRSHPAKMTADVVLKHLPPTNNADMMLLVAELVRIGGGIMSWEALGWTILTARDALLRCNGERFVELLWSGPTPVSQIPARRIDQVLYDLICAANREILLVTFAATRIDRLASELIRACRRGVRVRLVLEFEADSEGQLSFDALKAFPDELTEKAEIFHWPIGNRTRNQAGRPGKLHAKVAIIDRATLISSANLTDDAFTRNLELGVLVAERYFHETVKMYIEGMMAKDILRKI